MIPVQGRIARHRFELLARDQPLRALTEMVVRLAHGVVLYVGLAADNILTPSWRTAPIDRPVFIVGHQRTGTTALHRALGAADEFTGSDLAWLLFPSIALHRIGRATLRCDRMIGSPLGWFLRRIERRLFAPLDDVHVTRFAALEEDEFAFWATMGTTMSATDHPSTLGTVSARRDDLPDRQRARLIRWYEMVIRKRIRLDGGRYLGKNPAATTEANHLLTRFPDATFIVLHRPAEAAIASRQKLVQSIWMRAGYDPMKREHTLALEADSVRTLAAVDQVPGPVIRIDHSEIVADLTGTVARVARELGAGAGSHPELSSC